MKRFLCFFIGMFLLIGSISAQSGSCITATDLNLNTDVGQKTNHTLTFGSAGLNATSQYALEYQFYYEGEPIPEDSIDSHIYRDSSYIATNYTANAISGAYIATAHGYFPSEPLAVNINLSSHHINFFYGRYLSHSSEKIRFTIVWKRAGDYKLSIKLVEMTGGTRDNQLNFLGSISIGGSDATVTDNVVTSTEIVTTKELPDTVMYVCHDALPFTQGNMTWTENSPWGTPDNVSHTRFYTQDVQFTTTYCNKIRIDSIQRITAGWRPEVTATIAAEGHNTTICSETSAGYVILNISGYSTPFSIQPMKNGEVYGDPIVAEQEGNVKVGGLSKGEYTFIITDVNECSVAVSGVQIAEAQQDNVISLTATPTHVTCYGGNNGSVSTSREVTTGVQAAPYIYEWSNQQSGEDVTSISGITAGNYSVTVTDNMGCTATASVTVSEAEAITSSKEVWCCTSQLPYHYDPNGPDTVFNEAGIKNVVYQAVNGCDSVVSVTLHVWPAFGVTNLSKDTTYCIGEEEDIAELSVSVTGSEEYTYQWQVSNDNGTTWSNISGATDDVCTPTTDVAGTFLYRVYVKDENGCGETTVNVATITIPNALEITLTVPTTAEGLCPNQSTYPVSMEVTGGHGGNTIVWSGDAVNASAQTNAEMTTSSTVVNQIGTAETDCGQAYTATVTVTDEKGCTATETATFTVADNVKPTISLEELPEHEVEGCSADLTESYPAYTTVAALVAAFEADDLSIYDNCTADENLSLSVSETSTGTCPIVVTRSYTITDRCGNDSTIRQTITVNRPDFTITAAAGAATVACPDLAVAPTLPTVTDACGNTLQPTAESPVTGGTYTDCEGTITYTYTYEDCAEHSHDWVFTYTIEYNDFEMPDNDGQTVACADEIEAPELPTVTDNCGNELTGVLKSGYPTETPACEGTVEYVYTFTDCEGNAHDWTYTYTILPPELTFIGEEEELANTEEIDACYSENLVETFAEYLRTDADVKELYSSSCDRTITVSHEDVATLTDDCGWKITRTFTITNGCTTVDTTQYISGSDQTAPTLTGTWPNNITGQNNCMDNANTSVLYNNAQVKALFSDCSAITVDSVDVVTSTDCQWTVTRTYTVKDACGNIYYTDGEQTLPTMSVSGSDQTAPALRADAEWPDDIENQDNCKANASVDDLASDEEIAALFIDNCGGTVSVSHVDANAIGNDCEWTIVRTYTIKDACNNIYYTNADLTLPTQSVSGSDQSDPTFTKPDDITICCSGNLALDTVPAATGNVTDVADNCTAEPTVTYVDGTITGDEHSTRTFVRTWTVTDACGNSATDEQTITINPQVVMNTPENQAICEGQALNVTFGTTITDGTVTYAWSRDNTENIYGDEAGTGNIADVELTMTTTASNSQPVVFTVTPTYTNNGKSCEGTPVTFTVTVNALPTVTLAAIDDVTAICEGETTKLQAGCETAEEYEWHKGNATIAGETDDLLEISEAGKYVVLVTDGNGCSNTSDTVTITVYELPDVTITGAESVCYGSTTTLTASGAESYSWSDDRTDESINVTITEETTITVTGTDSHNCSATDEITIAVNALPTVTLTITKDGEDVEIDNNTIDICLGGTLTISAPEADGYSYEWGRGSAELEENSETLTLEDIAATDAGKYAVKVTDANGCSNTSDSLTVIVNALPDVNASVTDVTCTELGSVTLTVNGTPDFTCSWNDGETVNITEQNADELYIITFNELEGNEYSYVITDGNGCVTEDQVVVTDPGTVSARQSIANAESCYGEDNDITFTITGGAPTYMVQWVNVNNSEILAEMDEVTNEETTITLNELEAGEYRLAMVITDVNECTGNAIDTIEFTIWPTYNIVREINIGTGLDEYTYSGQTYAITNGIPEIPETEELETAHGCDSIISYVVNQYDLEIIFADTCILTRSSYNRAYTNTPNELLGDTIYLAKNTPSYFYAYLNNTTETIWNGERMDMSYELQYSEQAISEDDMPNLVENFSISTYYDRSGAYYGVTDLTEPTGEIPSTTFAFRQTANSTIMQFDYFYFEAFKDIPNKVTFTGLENGTYTLKLKAELRNSDPETGTDRNGIYNPYIVNRRYGHILGGYGDTVGTKEVIAARNLTIIVNEDGVNPSGAPAAINEYSHEASVRSFPNPVNDQLNLVINGMEGNTQITITDAQGKVVRVINAELTGGTEVLTYSVSDFAQGIYFLNVRNSEKVISQKFIVTKR